MLLHLIDDEKFIPDTVEIFDSVYPGKNIYLVGWGDELNVGSGVQTNGQIFFAKQESREYYQIIGDIFQYEAVIIHYLNNSKWKLVKKNPDYRGFIWIAWGGDFYSKISEWRLKLYGKETRKALNSVRSKTIIERWIRGTMLFNLYSNLSAEIKLIIFRNGLKNISFYSTVLPIEKEILTKHFKLKIPYVPYNYGIKTDYTFSNKNSSKSGQIDVLVGNSGSPTNNHIEILKILAQKGFKRVRLIVPLNYGASPEFIENISFYGKEKFGKGFLTLEKFLEQREYFDILSGCKVCIMNHYRQQGSGNVAFMIAVGAKVYLSELNPLYRYFIDQGIVIYSIEKDLMQSNEDNFLRPLDESQIVNNKMIFEHLYGTKAILARAATFVEKVLVQNHEIVE